MPSSHPTDCMCKSRRFSMFFAFFHKWHWYCTIIPRFLCFFQKRHPFPGAHSLLGTTATNGFLGASTSLWSMACLNRNKPLVVPESKESVETDVFWGVRTHCFFGSLFIFFRRNTLWGFLMTLFWHVLACLLIGSTEPWIYLWQVEICQIQQTRRLGFFPLKFVIVRPIHMTLGSKHGLFPGCKTILSSDCHADGLT